VIAACWFGTGVFHAYHVCAHADTHIISEGGHLHPSAVANRVASHAAAAIALQPVSEDKDAILDNFDEEVVMVAESSTWWKAFLESKEDGQNTKVVFFCNAPAGRTLHRAFPALRIRSAGRPPNHAGCTCRGSGFVAGELAAPSARENGQWTSSSQPPIRPLQVNAGHTRDEKAILCDTEYAAAAANAPSTAL